MTNHIARMLSLSLLLAAPTALAQGATPSIPAAESAAEPEQPTPTHDQPTSTVEQPVPTAPIDLAAKVDVIEAKLGGLEEAQAATETTVGGLKKLKLSGYIQGRYEHSATSEDGLKSDGKTPANHDSFAVRRARLKAIYQGTNAEYKLEIDATGDGVALKDAEATFVDTWTPFNIHLTVGQFKVPFGYEATQSSGSREMPERAAIVKAYFNGERDRGLRLTARWQFLRLAVALINGNGVKDTSVYQGTSVYGTKDPNKFKDFVGRLGVDFGNLVGGVSAYFGRGPMATTVDTTSTPPTVTYDYMRRTRLGADVQGYIDVPEVGGLALKGELIWGSEAAIDNWAGVPSDPSKNVRKLGWILTAVQNLGDYLGVVVRFDQLDPNTSADNDKVYTLGGGVLVHPSSNIKATLTYEHLMEEGTKVDNDLVVAQLQAKF